MDIEENISKINEHIERVKEYLEYGMPYSEYLDLQISFETILNELDKKDKIIDKLAFALADYVMYYEYDKCRNPEMIKNKAKEQIEYFTNKVEEGKGN